MSLEIFIEGYRVGSKWGWRMMKTDGDIIALDHGSHKTKKSAVAAGKVVAIGFYQYPEAEVIELTRVHR